MDSDIAIGNLETNVGTIGTELIELRLFCKFCFTS